MHNCIHTAPLPPGQTPKNLSLLTGGNGWTRTNHTQIFSLLLYLMSYVANNLAEAVRFELTVPFDTLVFKTRAIDHSTTLPLIGTS